MAQTRRDKDIRSVLNDADDQVEKGVSKWPGMMYEDGVAATIRWMTEYAEPNLMVG